MALKEGLPRWFSGKKKKKKKNLPASAEAARDSGSTPASGRSPGVGNSNYSSIPVSIIPWTEEPGGL